MEPLAALGIAGNIVQFIDFSSKLISNTSKIHHSVSGLPEDLEDAAAVTKNLNFLMGQLPTPVLAPNASANDKSLAELVSNCRGTCSELQELVEKIKGKQSASRTASFRIALRGMRQKGKLKGWRRGLIDIGASSWTMCSSYFEEQSDSMKSMVKSQADLAGGLAQGMRDQFQETRREILKVLQPNTDASSTNAELREIHNSLEKTSTAMKAIDAEKEVLKLLWFSDLRTRSNTIERAHEGTYRWLLHEPEPEDPEWTPESSFREVAHSETESKAPQLNKIEIEPSGHETPSPGDLDQADHDQRVDEQHRTVDPGPVVTSPGIISSRLKISVKLSKTAWRERFTNWLQAGNGSFYISGKPGAGKSTLMKSIAHDPRTEQLLQAWANQDGKTLIFVSFFFWISGSQVQRSITGLYRSMLWEILQQAPQLIKDVLPTLFRKASASTLHESDFDLAHLEITFKDLIHNKTLLGKYKVCFFIDGLVEYDGDHWALSRNLKSWCSVPDVKICVSSRPHNEFIANFGQPGPWLKLHELTQEDILCVVRDQFANDERLVEARKLSQEYDELTHSIVYKAEGVFVWVIMTMRSLLTGIGNSCSMAQLKKRLNDVPAELNAMFRSMLDGIEPSERQAAARVFLTMKCPEGDDQTKNYVYIHAVMDDLVDNPAYEETLLDGKLGPFMSFEELDSKCVAMGRRLVGRCRGLISVPERDAIVRPFYNRVKFVHRTVSDFLGEPETLDGLRSMAGDFEPLRALVLSLISKFKHTPFSTDASTVLGRTPFMVSSEIMAICGCAERAGHPPFSAEIESFTRMAVEFATLNERFVKDPLHQSRSTGLRRIKACTPGTAEATILYQAITFGALAYAEKRLMESKIEANWALFLAFLEPFSYSGEPNFGNQSKIVRLLLEQTTVAPNSELPPGSYRFLVEAFNRCSRVLESLSPAPWTLWILVLMETSVRMFRNGWYLAKQSAQVLELFLRHGADQSVCFIGYQLRDNGISLWTLNKKLSESGGDFSKVLKGPFKVDLPRMLAIWGLELEYDLSIGMKQGLWTVGRALMGAMMRGAPATIQELPRVPGEIPEYPFLVLKVVPFQKIKDVQTSELEGLLKMMAKGWEPLEKLRITLYL